MSQNVEYQSWRKFQRVSVPQAAKAVELLDLFLSDIEGDPSAVRYHDLRMIEAARILVAEIKQRNA